MKYMLSSTSAYAGVDPLDWAPDGEPVVPWYPATLNNAFLAIGSFRPSMLAEVRTIDVDPDVLVDRLVAEYPGLPRKLHENYVLAIALAATKYADGTRFKVLVDQDSATLQQLGTDKLINLWTEQPMK